MWVSVFFVPMRSLRIMMPIFIVAILFISLAPLSEAADTTPPVTTLTITGPQWNMTIDNTSYTYVNTTTQFNLTSQDVDGTVSNISYRVWHPASDWTAWTVYAGNFTIDTTIDGFYHIEYYAMDNSSNNETVNNQTVFVDVNEPDIESHTPLDNAMDVPWDTNFTIEFNEPMNTTSVEDVISFEPDIEIDSYEWTDNNMSLEILFKENMIHSTNYIVTVGMNASDLMGDTLGYNFTFSFTIWQDFDDDGLPDHQDEDDDNDGALDIWEVFMDTSPLNATDIPTDTDNDGAPDGDWNNSQAWMDLDDDNDTVSDVNDTFPTDPREQIDSDGDGIGDYADEDDDNDDVDDLDDAFPLNDDEWADTDEDGIGNNEDTDDDDDGVVDIHDAFPLDKLEFLDTDRDGIGNNADTDDDNDNVTDGEDPFPLDKSEWADFDGDGIGDNGDTDDDNDGYVDSIDPDPYDAEVGRFSDGIILLWLIIAIIVVLVGLMAFLVMKGPPQ